MTSQTVSIEVSFKSVPKVLEYASKPGVYRDTSESGFALEVSPKGKAIWTVRVRSVVTRKEVPPKVMDFERTFLNGRSGTNYELAKLKAQEIKERARMTEEELKTHIGHTLDEGFRLYLKERRNKGEPLGQKTKMAYLADYNRYLKPHGHRILKDTKAGYWSDVLRPLNDKSPSHALSTHALLSGIYSHLIGNDYLDVNPLVKVRMQQFLSTPTPRDDKVQTLDMRTFVANIAKLHVRHSRDIVMLFLITGFRHLALLSIRWDGIDFENGFYEVPIGVPGWKGFSGRVPLSDFALEILRKRRETEASHGTLTEYVFPNRTSSKKSKVRNKAELRELEMLGIEIIDAPHRVSARSAVSLCSAGLDYKIHPHDLRRTYISAVHAVMGGDLKACAALLCHRWVTDAAGKVHTEMQISANYVVQELQKLRVDANRVVQFIREISGQVTMSNGTKLLVERLGINPSEFVLLAEPDNEPV